MTQNLKKKLNPYYFAAALVVLVVGVLAVWIIVERLPDWMGTTGNQHRFIDRLESDGAIDFSVQTLGGETIQLEQFKGKIVILSFWASWCGPCVEEFPSMMALLDQFPNDIVMIAISSDYTKEDIGLFFQSLKLKSEKQNLFVSWDPDHKVSQQYEVQRLPESFVFGKNQKLLRKVVGSIKWNEPEALEYFKEKIRE